MSTVFQPGWRFPRIVAAVSAALFATADIAIAQQRVLGVDISYWNTGNNQSPGSPGISQANWDTGYTTGNRQFAFIRATRGGTTGVDQPAGTPGGGSLSTLSRRYDDPRFIQNITRATTAGMFAGPYHYGRLDIVANWPTAGQVANNGTDEANHFIEMAGAWMRPGYLMPMFDLEDGQDERTLEHPEYTPGRTPNDGAQFCIDFSNRIYEVMGIRPAMYINGTYSSWLQSASSTLRNQLAQPSTSTPSMVGPAFPMLWDARYAYQGNDSHPGIQTANPKDTASTFYGPWDDYGDTQPWDFWQYSSTSSIPGFNAVDTGVDSNVSHGDIEYVRNYLAPAVWWNDSSGDWSTLANWNSGQAPIVPNQAPGQATPFATGPLPTARLPGAAGSGPTSGQYDTVILERPNANITVTVSTGTHNIRKLYMRETLNITGGSLTINYDPTYRPDNSTSVLHGGPLSAQFSGPVMLSGTGSLSVHTLQVDATRDFVVGNSSLTFNKINLMPHSSLPAEIYMSGTVSFDPLNNAAAVIANGAGSGSSGRIELVDGTNPVFNVADGSAAVDLAINVPILGTGLTKTGAGTLALNGLNNYNGDTVIQAGTLSITSPNGFNQQLDNEWDVHISSGATLDLNFTGAPDTIGALYFDGISQQIGTWGAVDSAAQFTSPLITGTGLLQVSTFIAPALPGDFNEDGAVDAADYVVWRDNENTTTALPNDNNIGGTIGQAHYDLWQANFGNSTAGSGSAFGAATVPEPASLVLVTVALCLVRGMARRVKR